MERAWTLEEKVAQLFMVGSDHHNDLEENLTPFESTGLGGVLLFRYHLNHLQTAEEAQHFITNITQRFKGGGLTFMALDQEGGQVERLPYWLCPTSANAACLGLHANTQLTQYFAQEVAQRMRWLGFNLNFAPCLDLASELLNPIIGLRSYGQSPDRVIAHAQAVMDTLLSSGILPVAKHFPGHGSAVVDSHEQLPLFDQWQSEELLPYQALMMQNLPAVLMAHGRFPAVSKLLGLTDEIISPIDARLTTGLLKEELKFSGLVFSDDLMMGAAQQMADPVEITVNAITAGVDVLVWRRALPEAYEVYQQLVKRYQQGKLPEQQLDNTLAKILQTRRFLAARPKPNYDEKALTPETCKAISLNWAQSALVEKHHHFPSPLPLNQFMPWVLIMPDTSQLVHFQSDWSSPHADSAQTMSQQAGIPVKQVVQYNYRSPLPTENPLPLWPDEIIDVMVFVAYNSMLDEAQQQYYQQLQLAHPKAKMILVSAGNPVDDCVLSGSWAHVVLPSLRPTAIEALLGWLTTSPLKRGPRR